MENVLFAAFTLHIKHTRRFICKAVGLHPFFYILGSSQQNRTWVCEQFKLRFSTSKRSTAFNQVQRKQTAAQTALEFDH